MNLEEFRKSLESDATKRNAAQEVTIKKQRAEIQRLTEQIAALEKDKRQLMNRCKVTTQGLMCIFCGFKKECFKKEDG